MLFAHLLVVIVHMYSPFHQQQKITQNIRHIHRRLSPKHSFVRAHRQTIVFIILMTIQSYTYIFVITFATFEAMHIFQYYNRKHPFRIITIFTSCFFPHIFIYTPWEIDQCTRYNAFASMNKKTAMHGAWAFFFFAANTCCVYSFIGMLAKKYQKQYN